MSIQVKFRRGTTTQHNSFTGANGEITVDTTIKTLRVHDGATVGGIRLARYSEIGTATQYLQVANASALYTTKAYAAANSYVKTLLANTNSYIATKPQYYYSTTMYNYTQYGLGYMNVAPNQNPATLGFRTDVPAPPFGSIWILAVNDGLVDTAPITIYSPNTRTTPMLWMSIDGSGPFSDANPNGQAYWFNITPPPSGA